MDYFSDNFSTLNKFGSSKTPFLFIISYDKKSIFCSSLDKLEQDIYYKIENTRNYTPTPLSKSYKFEKYPLNFLQYKQSFDKVIDEIKRGNTYLLNLTFSTPIKTDLNLKEIFTHSKAKYKLYFKDQFVCFSPEKFIEIKDNTISTYPMKGTIDASIKNAKEEILSNQKEMSEHTMIVDLMRNDLGIVANKIKVNSFRYIDEIKAGSQNLLQVSSHISGKLESNWHEHIGDILDALTPAGSISGTPKKSTLGIIEKTENHKRGFYSGIFGIYDGKTLNSAVMIRFIEKSDDELVYKSGGGITLDSDANDEYEEMIRKVYLPF
ncbi:MAG: aminodeoxychorismate synthase component I [Sulfurovaceae bacterium]|nr:aminodeoxychorismate synthase component I [Sulfurovaceae bacterium]MDD5549319.1 aminodeoxychorismate synthase component I [Sulfurovaceae bacterium]